MELPNEFKLFSLLCIAASIGGFFGAYLSVATVPPSQPPIAAHGVLNAVSEQLTVTAQQVAELQQNYQTAMAADRAESSQLQHSWLTRLVRIEDKLDELVLAHPSSLVSPASVVTTDTDAPAPTLQAQLDYQSVQDVISAMYSEDFNTRQRALRALVLIGSPSIKQEIGQIILNETEDPILRRDLIQSMDWQGLGNELVHLFDNSDDAVIRAAAVSASETSQLNAAEQQLFENSLLNNFATETDDFIRIVTLDYFANRDSPHLPMLSNSLENEDISTQLREHIEFLTLSSTQ